MKSVAKCDFVVTADVKSRADVCETWGSSNKLQEQGGICIGSSLTSLTGITSLNMT